jgi:hypothetical protein
VQKDSCFEVEQVRYVLQNPQKCSCVDTARKQKKLIGTVSVRVFDVYATKLHISNEPCVRRHRFCMTTKSPTLNISAIVPSSVSGFEKPGQTRFPCVFVAQLRCAHTLTCIIRGLYFHVSTGRYISKVRSSCPPCTVQPWRKSLRKSFVMHLFERFTVWCSLLVLKMSSSARSPDLPLLVCFLFLTLLAHSPLGV